MDKEKLITAIMKEAEKDGEPLTYEEACEVAEMEIKAGNLKRYEQAEKPRKKAERIRKVDEEKLYLLNKVTVLLGEMGAENITSKTETEVNFTYKGSEYTYKLTKHRPPKE